LFDIPSLCSDLAPVRPEHDALFEAATQAYRKAWNYYFPFLYLNGLSARNWTYTNGLVV